MTAPTDALTTEFDEQRAEAFAERFLGVLNDTALALLTSVGHQAGLFDVMAGLPPARSDEIATAAGLEERYVREWLSGMVTGRVVEYDPGNRSFRLPPEHAAFLTRDAGPDNLATMTEVLTMLAGVEDPIVECFRHGGGVPYSEFTDFHRLMAEESRGVHDAALVDAILPLVDGLPERLRQGIDVADIGCGSGHAVNLIGQAFPASRAVGYDFSEEAIAAARREADELGLANVEFEVRDVSELEVENGFDLVTAFDAIHDQARPDVVLANVARALRADGVFLMVDIGASTNLEENLDHPIGTLGYTLSTLHCMTVSLSLGGAGLGTFWGREKAQEMLAEAGFTSVEVHRVEGDIFNEYYVARKG